MIPDHPQHDYRGLRVLIMGLGSFGGGLGAVRFFAARGARVVITDTRTAEKLSDAMSELRDNRDIELKLGGHDDLDFQNADLVVVNPAIPRDNRYLAVARAAGVPLTSEMNLFWQWNPAPVVAVTGSNGKSTTTALIHSILDQTGRRAWLGGNIGISLLPRVAEIRPDDVVVLELSSFQLTDLDRLHVSPVVSVITNFAPNHLDWHGTLAHYRWAKQTMLRWQRPGDCAVLNGDDQDVSSWMTPGERLNFGFHDPESQGVFDAGEGLVLVRLKGREETLPISEWLKLPGRHNMANAMAAICACLQLGANSDAVRRGLESFKPLPHRLQWIADVDGRSFYNDSLATTPESVEAALDAFEAPIMLLAGGYDKLVDLSRMADAIAKKAKAVALIGQTAGLLRELIATHPESPCVVSSDLSSLQDAFSWAVSQSSPGDVVLLSPGCASYDWFRNFADRGDQFVKLVMSLAEKMP